MPPEIHNVTHDEAASAAYIYFTEIKEGSVARSVQVPNTPLILDFDADGTLVGIESLNPAVFPTELLEQATEL